MTGKAYSSDRIRFGDVYSSDGNAYQVVAEHPVGKQVPVSVPTLAFTDPSGSPCQEKLVEWFDRARGEELAAWLREKLRADAAKKDLG